MKVEQQNVGVPARTGRLGPALIADHDVPRADIAHLDDVLDRLPPGRPRYVVCAPGRLDVIGGLSNYAGSLAVGKTVGDHVCVAAQRCPEAVLRIELIGPRALDGGRPTVIPLCDLWAARGTGVGADRWSGGGKGPAGRPIRCVVGAVVETIRAKMVSPFDGGLSLAVASTMTEFRGRGGDAAMASATLLASAAALDVRLEPADAVTLCQRVSNEWLAVPVGLSDGACVLFGDADHLMPWQGDPAAPSDGIPLPDDLAIVGIDSGSVHPDVAMKNARVRTAAFMGRVLIDRIVQHEGMGPHHWDGCLAHVSISDFVERFRDRIPTSLTGGEFLERFGNDADPLTRIEPDVVYKVRSRTEHHVYEHSRACQFVELITRGIRHHHEQSLLAAGELMYASHWSYGQRCGLGHVATDALVQLIRRHAEPAGVYGAKVSARGCGGVVVVLMRASPETTAALQAVMEHYRVQTGYTPALLDGSLPGAMVSGVRRL